MPQPSCHQYQKKSIQYQSLRKGWIIPSKTFQNGKNCYFLLYVHCQKLPIWELILWYMNNANEIPIMLCLIQYCGLPVLCFECHSRAPNTAINLLFCLTMYLPLAPVYTIRFSLWCCKYTWASFRRIEYDTKSTASCRSMDKYPYIHQCIGATMCSFTNIWRGTHLHQTLRKLTAFEGMSCALHSCML